LTDDGIQRFGQQLFARVLEDVFSFGGEADQDLFVGLPLAEFGKDVGRAFELERK